MKKQIMNVDILNEIVLADTDGFVNLNSLALAGNQVRLKEKKAYYQLAAFLDSKYLAEYLTSASKIWGKPLDSFLKKGGSKKTSHTLAHVSVAVLLAEQMSSDFHAAVHKQFIDGRLLENRLYGGEEFKRVNRAIDAYLPSPSGCNIGRYINVAKWVRAKCEITKPEEDDIDTWNQKAADSVAQLKRGKLLDSIAMMVEVGAIKDWDSLKEIVEKINF
jgi:hypothetical protein